MRDYDIHDGFIAITEKIVNRHTKPCIDKELDAIVETVTDGAISLLGYNPDFHPDGLVGVIFNFMKFYLANIAAKGERWNNDRIVEALFFELMGDVP